MKSTRQLVKTELLAAAALTMVALAVASIFVLLEVLSPSELWGPSGAFIAGLYATLVLGAVPAVLFGAPGYWLLWRLGRARWLTVLPLGAAFGALVAVLEPALLPWGITCGIVTAAITHVAAGRWLGGAPPRKRRSMKERRPVSRSAFWRRPRPKRGGRVCLSVPSFPARLC
jgi:hypothetical protein